MTVWSILSGLFRLVGFTRLAESLWEKHETKVKAQSVADAPTTRDELEETLEKGEL